MTAAPGLRNRRWIAALLGAGLLSGAAIWRFSRVPEPRELVEQGLAIQSRDPVAAEQLFRDALRSSSGNAPDARLALAWALGRRGAWEEAAELLHAPAKFQGRGDLAVAFARSAVIAGRQELAEPVLASVRDRQTPERIPALEALVALYREQLRQEEFIDALRELAAARSSAPEHWTELIQMLKAAGRDAECAQAAREALQQNLPETTRTEIRYLLAQQLAQIGQSAEAWSQIGALEQEGRSSPRLMAIKAELLRTSGRFAEALKTMTEAFPGLNSLPEAYLARGAIYLDLERFQEAAADFAHVIEMRPHHEGAHFKLSEAYRLLGRTDLAERHREIGDRIHTKRIRVDLLLKSVSQTPDPGESKELSTLYLDLGDPQAAEFWEHRARQPQ